MRAAGADLNLLDHVKMRFNSDQPAFCPLPLFFMVGTVDSKQPSAVEYRQCLRA
jgi:hypothetical protein